MDSIVGLERFACVRRMLEDISLLSRSAKTKYTYLQALHYFVRHCGFDDLDVLMEDIKGGKLDPEEIYRQYAVRLTSAGLAPKSVSIWLTGLKRLFTSNGIRLKGRIRLKGYVVNESVLPSTELLSYNMHAYP
jgi:hypothetical protein